MGRKEEEEEEELEEKKKKKLNKQSKTQTHKRFEITLFIRTKHNKRIFGVIPLIELQNDTQTTIKRWKNAEN